jgi:cytochrome c biogenesis protein
MTETTSERAADRQAAPQPAGFLPDIPGPWETAQRLWRRLRKMSTALGLLFALAIASIIATFVPQEPIIPSTVRDWRSGEDGPGELTARVFDALGFFDVFGSWWFMIITVLLFVSLTGCLVPRWRQFARIARRPPAAGRNLERLTQSRLLVSDLPAAEALDRAETVLARARFRRRRVTGPDGEPQLATERGHWREGGSLVFHTAFYVLLIGIVLGHTFGFVGQINVPEGATFSDTRIGYDLAQPGRFFGLEDHRGFAVHLDDFQVDYFEDFTPSDFVSTITILEQGEAVRTEEVRVNHPVSHAGMKIYQARFGMAPNVVVRAGDTVLFDERVMLSDAGGWIWTGAAKVVIGDPSRPDPPPQVALELVFLPDASLNAQGQPFSRSPVPTNPRLVVLLHVGELGLERPVPATQADLTPESVVGEPAILAEGDAAEMAAGALTVEFSELAMWSGFQVSHAPARWLLLLAGGLLLAGLVPSLYSYRRRIWVQAAPADEGSRVVVAGVALHRKSQFGEDFDRIADDVARAIDARPRHVQESDL